MCPDHDSFTLTVNLNLTRSCQDPEIIIHEFIFAVPSLHFTAFCKEQTDKLIICYELSNLMKMFKFDTMEEMTLGIIDIKPGMT